MTPKYHRGSFSSVYWRTPFQLMAACTAICCMGCSLNTRYQVASLDGEVVYEQNSPVHIDLSRGEYLPMSDEPGHGGVSLEPYFFEFQRPKDIGDAEMLGMELPSTLKRLDLVGCDVGIPTMEHIQESCPNIETIDLSGTEITDSSLKVLSHCTKLTTLNLSGTNITDDGIEHLEKLTSLEEVYLVDTCVGIEGVRKLLKLPKMRMIHVLHAPLSREEIEQLKESDADKIDLDNPFSGLLI